MQANKYIANAPMMQTQPQRVAMVNQGVRANMINFQAGPPAGQGKVVNGEKKITVEKAKTWFTKWGPLVLISVLAGAKMFGAENKPAPVVVKKGFGKR